jgi:hypothetical protein
MMLPTLRRARSLVSAILVSAAMVPLAACSSASDLLSPYDGISLRNAPIEVRQRVPDMTGAITMLLPDTAGVLGVVRVEERPGDLTTGGQKAIVRVSLRTRLFRIERASLRAIPFAELRVGTIADVWFSGPVAESYPVQGEAAVLVVR